MAYQPVKNTYPFRIKRNSPRGYRFYKWDEINHDEIDNIIYFYSPYHEDAGPYSIYPYIQYRKDGKFHILIEDKDNNINSLEEAKQIILEDWNKRNEKQCQNIIS